MFAFKPIFILILISTFILIGCNNTSNDNTSEDQPSTKRLKEIISRTYSASLTHTGFDKGQLEQMEALVFDKYGRASANVKYKTDGTIDQTEQFDYNDKGFKIGTKVFNSGQQLTKQFVYELDDKGREIGFVCYSAGDPQLLDKGRSEYLEDGRIRRDGQLDNQENFVWQVESIFDANGLEVGRKIKDKNSGEITTLFYKFSKYNEDGEWIEKFIINGDKASKVETREFVYVK